MHLTGAREQTTVEVVNRIAQLIIICIEIVLAFQQLHLALHAPLLEHLDGLLYGALHPVDGHICIDNLLHTALDALHVLVFHRATNAQLTVITATDGTADKQLCIGIGVLHSLCQDEEERAGVSAHTAVGGKRQELHVLVIVEAVVHALHLVVHASCHRAVFHLEVCFGEDIIEVAAERHAYPLAVIAASYSKLTHLPLLNFIILNFELKEVPASPRWHLS